MSTSIKDKMPITVPPQSHIESGDTPSTPRQRKSSVVQEKHAMGADLIGTAIEVLWFDEETGRKGCYIHIAIL